jgi:integrase/recombinase XerD
VEDYFQQGRRSWLRLHEKGKRHEVPCHHSLDQYLDAWIAAAGIGEDKKGPLFRSFKKGDKLTGNPMIRRRRALHDQTPGQGSRPTLLHLLPYFSRYRNYRLSAKRRNLEHAQQVASHQSPRITKLYDRTEDEISLDEVERLLSIAL